jgi:peptidyl-prolyl cis-trans isomerase D
MLSFFRRVSKSKIGTGVMAGVLIAILAGFAYSDISNFGSGKMGFGMGSGTLLRIGDQEVTEREMADAMQRRLQEVRQQKPEADYSTIAGDFDTILDALADQRALIAFGNKYDFRLSKRLIDAEIAQIPAVKGLNGQFSQQAYDAWLAQQHLTDARVREIIAGGLLQRLMLVPVATNSRVSVGMATPYASMLLESREGEAAAIPVEPFRAGLNPTDADIQRFYTTNRARYMIPEQRVLRFARIGPDQVANATASDQEIAAAYNANKAVYAPKDTRTVTQAVAQDQATANAIAAKVKGGATIAAAAGANAAVTTAKDQTRQDYAGAAGDKVAAAVFSAPAGALVGPVQGDFGWVVAKIDSVKTQGGKTLDQARPGIAAKLNADKRKQAIEDIVDKVQDAVDQGSNFAEAAAQAKLPVSTTPLITAAGASRVDTAYKAPPELAQAIKTGFDIAPNDPPEIVSVGTDQGYVLVSPGQVVTAAPAPLASIRDTVAGDWINARALERARAAAAVIVARTSRGMSLADALKQSGVALPPVRPIAARRIQIATAQGEVPVALKMLFTLGPNKSQMFPDPQRRGFFVVKVDKIVPGNALLQPGLISRMQAELRDPVSDDYARQFLAAVREQVTIKRNDAAIRALKARMIAGGAG